MIPESTIDEIKNKVDIVEIIGEYVQLTRRGEQFWGLSPFKDEKTPSFTVTPAKQFYYCFSTQKGGTVFSFLMEMEGFTYPEAIEYLGRKVGVDVHGQNYSNETKERKALEELYNRIAESFHFLLISSPLGKQALEYTRERGFVQETIEQFYLGYAHPDPFWLHSFLRKKGYSSGFLKKTSLFSKKNPQWSLFSQRLIFPIRQHQGEIVGFGGRILEGEGPKYINSPDNSIFHKRRNLYGIDLAKEHIKKTKSFILCEGYFDVLSFYQAGIYNAIAPLGTAFTPEQAKLLHRYSQKGTIVFDGDDAGVNATIKASCIMEEEGLDGVVISLDSGQDPASILAKSGSQKLQHTVQSSAPILEFILEEASSIFDKNTPHGKEQILEQVFPYIRSIKSPVKQEASLQIIADTISVSFRSIDEAFKQNRVIVRGRGNDTVQPKGSAQVSISSELLLLIAIIIHPEYYEGLRPQLKVEKFQETESRVLYSILEEHYRTDAMDFAKIFESIDNESLRNLVLKKASSDEYGNDPEKYILSVLKRVDNDLLRRNQKEIELLLRRKELSNDREALRELLSEKVYIDSKIENL